MASTSVVPLARGRGLILATLLVLAAAGWGLLIWQAGQQDADMMGRNALTMGMSALLFIGIWVAMMVAMMFPAAAPMILMFQKVSASKQQRGQAFVPTWVFVLAYLLIWTLFGVLAYLLARGAEQLASSSMWLMENAGRLGGVALILAGVYQLTPLKQVCLAKCRSPLAFIMSSWRDGYAGAVRMGVVHGLYCLGCCWLLFVILFPLGMMNIAILALITLLIFAEKSLPIGQRIGQVVAIGLIAYGAVILFVPRVLPTMM